MTRCAWTDALLDSTFAETGPGRSQIAHAAECADCARALVEARSFENELHRVSAELTPVAMPPLLDMGLQAAPQRVGASGRFVRAVVGGIAALFLATMIGGGLWLMRDAGMGTDASGFAPTDEEAIAWAEQLQEHVLPGLGPAGDEPWQLVRVERCRHAGIAFFEGSHVNGERTYAWAAGSIGAARPTATGIGDSIDDRRVARLRATLPPCGLAVDGVANDLEAVGSARDLWTLTTGEEEFEGAVRLIGATPVADGHRAGPNAESAVPTFLVILERTTDAKHWVERASISVTDVWAIGSEVGVERPGRAETMRVFADSGQIEETLFAWIDDSRVRAVNIWIPRESSVLRYTVTTPGFIVQFDARVAAVEEMRYEFIDEAGNVLASGAVAAWPPADPAP